MRQKAGRAAIYGVLMGIATAAVVEAVRPRGGTALLIDWDEVSRTAKARMGAPALGRAALAEVEKSYRSLARPLEKPLLGFVGGLPPGAALPRFEALDR